MSGELAVFDLLSGIPTRRQLAGVDMVLLGGSGDYSAASSGDWLERALDGLRLLYQVAKPTFASCWGFQAMARALGGRVIHDASRAELGTLDLHLTPAGLQDPVFAPLGTTFRGQAGHEDLVAELPPAATLLASSDLVTNQAYCFADRPIYCTQFHPELGRDDLLIADPCLPGIRAAYCRHEHRPVCQAVHADARNGRDPATLRTSRLRCVALTTGRTFDAPWAGQAGCDRFPSPHVP